MSTSPSARRMFMKQVAGATGALAVGSGPVHSQTAPREPVPAGYQSLGPEESLFTEALVNVMCPADELTPNGVACGLAVFIDRQLAGGFGRGDRLYRQPPVRSGKPHAGYQLPLTPEQFYKAGVSATQRVCSTRFGSRFEEIDSTQADKLLQDLAAGRVEGGSVSLAAWFNELVYPLFVQACFADPLYGGNRDKVFWKLIGYPGLPAFHTENMVAYRGKPFPGAKEPRSIQDFS